MNKNYYNILGIDKYSTQEDIKKAYRKLALKYHPDKNNNDEECNKKFIEINESYVVLGNEEKRKKYDMFGIEDNDINFDEDPFKMFNSIFTEHLNQFKNMQYENNFDVGNIINELSGLNFGNLFDIPKFNVKVNSFGDNKQINLDKIFNMENNISSNTENNLVEELIDDIVIHLDVTIDEIYKSKKKSVSYEKNRYKKGQIIKKKIKLEIDLYDKEIILEGNGNETKNKKGNVCIYLHCNKNDFVRINEYDIYYEKRVNFNDYYLNKYIEIKLPNDEIIYIEKVKGNKLIKIDKKGIPYKENDINYHGNLYCYFSIVMPDINNLYDKVNTILELENDKDEKKECIIYNYVNSYDIFNTE